HSTLDISIFIQIFIYIMIRTLYTMTNTTSIPFLTTFKPLFYTTCIMFTSHSYIPPIYRLFIPTPRMYIIISTHFISIILNKNFFYS
ncbi:hypothetical protein EB093_09695, partial [bacterium]|nr:hypothetical protein [bacterium]